MMHLAQAILITRARENRRRYFYNIKRFQETAGKLRTLLKTNAADLNLLFVCFFQPVTKQVTPSQQFFRVLLWNKKRV